MKKIVNYDKITFINILDTHKSVEFEYCEAYKPSSFWRMLGDEPSPEGWYERFSDQGVLSESQVIQEMEKRHGNNCCEILDQQLFMNYSIIIGLEDGSRVEEFFLASTTQSQRVRYLEVTYLNKGK